MATVTAHPNCRGARNASLLLAAAGLTAILLGPCTTPQSLDENLEGRAPTAEELRPSVEAAFPSESYAPGASASLVLFSNARGVTVRIFNTGPEHARTVGNSQMQGVPVTGTEPIGTVRKGSAVQIRVGNWTSGLYFARLTASDGRIGFAPFIVRPHRLGEHRVAVVLPTLTWQAYNLRDDNGDGKGDTWYANWRIHTARLGRPFLNRGVPYNFRRYDLPFLHWLAWTGRQVDFLSDRDLGGVASGQALASGYDLIVFPGHHEYVTTHEYNLVQSYRDLGGNLAFLSANNFFWRIVRHGSVIEKTVQWRDEGRPEASLIGVEYRGNDRGGHRGPWTVHDTPSAPWFFAGTGLKDDSTFGVGGIEIDKTAQGSPPGVKVLAEIPNLFGPGFTAQMTYYETPAGAKVFAAGAFTLAGQVLDDPVVGRLMQNLWARVAKP
jgi:N,N-dimethylformamidase beta subunit-like, C-terminal